jgi:hypothetical protein
MKTLLLATAFAVGSMGSAALAEGPQKLTEAQMDRVTAGLIDVQGIVGVLVLNKFNQAVAVAVANPVSIAVCVICVDSAAVSGDAIATNVITQYQQ